jgi:molybdopterin-guanine dinucleotide biosynthesis protein B
MDLVITEGYKGEDHPKIEVFRQAVGDGPLCLQDDRLMAVVSDAPLNPEFPAFATDDIEGLAAFLIARLDLMPPSYRNAGKAAS